MSILIEKKYMNKMYFLSGFTYVYKISATLSQ